MTRTVAALLMLRRLMDGPAGVEELMTLTGRCRRSLWRLRLDLEEAGWDVAMGDVWRLG